ncbi:MAG: hypothetical protein ACQEW0_01905 [Pseudomonadota bacterium]
MPKQDQLGAVHTLIHIGCGASPNIDEYISLAEHVWLIDADTNVLDNLDEIIKATDGDSYINVHTRLALVDADQAKATFYRYSLPWASGVAPVDEKTQRLYPGLKSLSSEEQTTTAIDTLVKECLSFTESENIDNHMLLLDCGYQNEALLQALEVSDEISCFSILVALPAHRQQKSIAVPPSLDSAATPPPTKLTLPANSQILQHHPQVQHHKQQIDEYKRLLKENAQQLKDAAKALRESEALREQDQRSLEISQQQLAERTQQRNEAKHVVSQQTEQHARELKTEQDKNAQLTKERDKILKQAHQHQQELAQSQQAEKNAHQKHEEEAQRADKAVFEKDAQFAELKEAQQLVEQIQTDYTLLTEEHKQLKVEYKEQQHSVQLNTKLLAKVEADASELRERYAKKIKSEQELKDLIKELHAKLQAASHFYHKLEQEHPELLEKL